MSTRVVVGIAGAAVGAVVGGPRGAMYGWAIGSMFGNVIDPQIIRGPSIGDIQQQTSQEGVPIPIVFGMSPPMAGNVWAAAPPNVVRERQSGKGGPKIETETIYRTYAVEFCEGPIGGFIRAWRNNVKVYDVLDDEFNTPEVDLTILGGGLGPTRNEKFLEKARFFLGTYDQDASTDLEAIYGAGTTAANRGIAYMVIVDEDCTREAGVIPQWQVQVADVEEETQVLAFASGRVIRSLDGGLTWSVETPSGLSGVALNSVAYSRPLGRLVGIDEDSHSPQVIRWSDDMGVTWNAASSPLASGTFAMGEIIWSELGNRFVVMYAGGSASAKMGMYSPDGDVWTVTPTANASIGTRYGITETTSAVVAIWGSRVAVSTDGISWSSAVPSPLNFSSSPARAEFVEDLGRIVVCSGNTAPDYSSAAPWTTWSASSGGAAFSGGAFAWSDELGLFATNFVNPYYSTNGINWSVGGSAATGSASKTIWVPGASRFVSVGSSSGPAAKIYTSDDGLSWVARLTTGSYIIETVVATTRNAVATDGVALVDVISRLCARAGLTEQHIELGQLDADELVPGFLITNQYPAVQALQALGQIYRFDISSYDNQIHFIPRGANSVATITEADMVEDEEEIEQQKRADSIQIPRLLQLSYHDADGDNLSPQKQSSERVEDRRATGEMTIQSAVLMDADLAAQACAIAHKVMAEDQKGELRFSLHDGFLRLVPSDPIIVQHDGKSERCRIEQVDILDGYQQYICVRDRQSAYVSDVEGIPPPVVETPPSQVVGPTLVIPLDIPLISDADDSSGLGYYVAVTGFTDVWPGALIELSRDGGANYTESRTATVQTIIGELTSTLEDHPQDYPDDTNEFTVRLYTTDSTLQDTDLEGMLNGLNLAAIGNAQDGWELINFASVTETDPEEQEWTISSLLRGRKHTQTREHVPDSVSPVFFVLLNRSTLFFQTANLTDVGRTLTFRSTTSGEAVDSAYSVDMEFTGYPQVEFPVGYLSAQLDGSDMAVSWQGAGRIGGGAQVAHGLSFTGYRVTFDDGADQIEVATLLQEIEQDVSSLSSPITVSVVQTNALTGNGPSTEVIV